MRKSTHSGEYEKLRRQLAGIRTGAGLSQRELARRLDVPHSWVAKVESGERRIDFVEFVWFCLACGGDAAKEADRLIRTLQSDGHRLSAKRSGGRR